MTRGIANFREYFKDYHGQYVIIGGTACELLFADQGFAGDFRATKDLDLVLIVELIHIDFKERFLNYIKEAGYEHINKSTGKPQFYRFQKPKSKDYPDMIELFARKQDILDLPADIICSPLSIDDSHYSLSAILLDDIYYDFLRSGLGDNDYIGAEYLIPFKAKAWLDLNERSNSGVEHIDSKKIKKHLNDVLRVSMFLTPGKQITVGKEIFNDLEAFLLAVEKSNISLKNLGIAMSKAELLSNIRNTYIEVNA